MDSIDEVEQYFTQHYDKLSGNYGVLLFMYTVMMTKVNRTVQIWSMHFVVILIKVISMYAKNRIIYMLIYIL